jgi:hypothetical protein
MAKKSRSTGSPAQVATTTESLPPLEAGGDPGESGIWIGRHAVDDDVLVFDPAETDPASAFVSFYSLTQYRRRSFPRAVVREKIVPLDDEVGVARAEKDYLRRADLEAENGARRETADSERLQQQRDAAIVAHRRHLELHGIEHQGVVDTADVTRKSRRTRCHACGIALDDFAGVCCSVCQGVLCSCGACGCGSPVRAR